MSEENSKQEKAILDIAAAIRSNFGSAITENSSKMADAMHAIETAAQICMAPLSITLSWTDRLAAK